MKKTLLSVLCVILIFIPTYIAIANYVVTQNAPISGDFVEKIDISDLDGNTFTVSKTKKEGDIVSFFVDMNSSAAKVTELPEPLVGTPFYKVTFHSGNVAEDYKYYFGIDGEQSYAEFPDGTVYKLDSAAVNKFLLSPYALSILPDENLPILKSSSNQQIIPSKVTWNYKIDNDNKYSSLKGFETTEEIRTYDMDGSIHLLFSSEADLYAIKAYDSESNLVYDELVEDLSTFALDGESDLTLMVTATWYEDSARKYYGEATYNFKVNLTAGAEFFIGLPSILPGEFVAIAAYNVSDVSKISFKSEPEIGFVPTFYQDGDRAIALVPIDVNLEHKAYVFTLSYGATQQEINLKIDDKTFLKRNHKVSEIIAKNTRSEAALNEFNEKFEEICATSETTRYFSGPFIDMNTDPTLMAPIMAGFGVYRTITSTNETYRSTGVDFSMAAGTAIPACNNGKVVYTGITTHGGRMVVIDHGLGLKTWYMHLNEIKVAVGDIVSTGDIIGTAGNSGFTETNGVFAIMTVGNMPVCPYDTWENGVVIYDK